MTVNDGINQSVAVVVAVQGKAVVSPSSGDTARILVSGDRINLNDVVETSGARAIVFKAENGALVSLGHDQVLAFDQELLDKLQNIIEEGSIGEAIEVDLVAQAIEEGRSLEEVLPAPAAGPESNFVTGATDSASEGIRIHFTADRVTPTSGFETKGLGFQDFDPVEEPGGLVVDAADPVEPLTPEPEVVAPRPVTPPVAINALVGFVSGPASVVEGEATTGYTVSVDIVPASDVTVSFTYSGVAQDGTDFTGVSSVTILASSTSVDFNIATLDDAFSETLENFTVTIVSVSGGSFDTITIDGGNDSWTTAITDQTGSDGTPGPEDTVFVTLVGNDTATEADGATLDHVLNLIDNAGNPVTLAAGQSVTVSLSYSADGTNAADFATKTTSVTITGSDTGNVVNTIADDFFAEGDESYTLTITGVSDDHNSFEALQAHATNNSVTGTIQDATSAGNPETPDADDTVYVRLTQNVSTIAEDGGAVTYTVSLVDNGGSSVTVPAGETITVGLSYGGTAGTGEYAGEQVSVTLNGGSTQASFVVTGIDDPVAEGNETIVVDIDTIADSGAFEVITEHAGNQVITTITDNDSVSVQSVTSDSDVEGTDLVHTVTLSGASVNVESFAFSLVDNTANAGSDYNGTPTFSNGVTLSGGNISVPAGVSSFTVTVATTDDVNEENSETYDLSVGGVAAVGTITDDDNSPVAQDDAYSINEDTTLNGTSVLLDNGNGPDSDLDGDSLSVVAAGPLATANGGTVTILADGTFTYIPLTDYNGPDSFDYTLTDGTNTDTGTVNITVNPVNDAPDAQPSAVTTLEDTPVVLTAADFNFTDVENDPAASITIQSLESVGSLQFNGVNVVVGDTITVTELDNGELTFTPFPDTAGNNYDNFTFTVNDADSGTVPGTMTIHVTPVDDGGVLPLTDSDPQVNRVVINAGVGVTVNLTGFSTDPDPEDTITYTLLDDDGGRFQIDSSTGVVTTATNFPGTSSGTRQVQIQAASSDGTTTNGFFDIEVVSALDDFATVHESALSIGSSRVETAFDSQDEVGQDVANGEGTAIATGNLLANDGLPGGTTITDIDGNTPSGGVITVITATGILSVDAATGDYTYTLTGPADNSAAADDLSVVDQFTYTTSQSTSADLNITIVDDTAQSADVVANLSEVQTQSYQLVFTLDVSGSMDNESGTINFTDGTSSTRMDMAESALIELAAEYFSQSDDVTVQFIIFENTATHLGTFTDLASFTAAVEQGNVSGGTQYDEALDLMISTLGGDPSDGSGIINDPSVETISYFISDGVPSDTAGAVSSAANWQTFAGNNNVDSYAVGIGTGISDSQYLDNIANVDIDGSNSPDGAVIVTDLRDLEAELLSTVPSSFGGSVVSTGDISNVVLGADDGYIQSISIMLDTNGDNTPETLVMFSYDQAASEVTNDGGYATIPGSVLTLDDAGDFTMGTFLFDFDDGGYTYYAGASVSEGDTFTLDFIAVDSDGDVTNPATLTINIVDGKPVANDDSDTFFAYDAGMEGNVVSGVGTDGGVSLGDAFTTFSSQGEGVDNAVDNAQVTSFVYRGDVIDLTTNSSATGVVASADSSTYNIDVVNGEAIITNGDGSSLVFNSSGYYNYIPVNVPTYTAPVSASPVVEDFTDNSEDNGVSASTSSGSITYNNGNGLGVDGGTWGDSADSGEDLRLTFDSALYPNGVEDIILNFGYDAGSGDVLFYDITGTLLAIVPLTGADTQTFNTVSGVGSLVIQTAANGDYSVQDITFTPLPSGPILIQEDFTDGAAGNGTTLTNPVLGAGFNRSADTDDGAGGEPGYLELTFDSATHPYGVESVTLNFDIADTGADGAIIIYHIDGHELGSVALDSTSITLPTNYSNIGRIEMIPNGSGGNDEWRLANVDFVSVALDNTSTAQEPEVIEYTLTDEDGGSDTATLTLTTIYNTIVGDSGNNTITGTATNDFIAGQDGDDTISGGDGADILEGGDGIDNLTGNDGTDKLVGGAGNDTLSGGAANDSLDGGEGDDTLDGGTGADTLDGGEDDDSLSGGVGEDILFGGEGNDTLDGGSDADTLYGNSGADIIIGGDGDDIIYGGSGDDTLTGNAGSDNFIWLANEQGTVATPSVDTITQFSDGVGGDVLNLSDLLQGEESAPLTDFIVFSSDGTDTTIQIDHNGGAFFQPTQTIVLEGIDLTASGTLNDQDILSNMISNGNLVTD